MNSMSLFHCLRYCTLCAFFAFSFTSLALNKIPEYQTTRLKSTAGAGVGSILMDEATILNPASIAYFNNGSFYFQKSQGDANLSQQSQEAEHLSFIASDAKGRGKGSVSYINQDYGSQKRKRLSAAFGYPAGKKSAIGATYRLTTDTSSSDNVVFNKMKYKQTVFGVSHALNNNFTLGAVFVDPFKARPEETRGLVGLQYVYSDFISLMLDGGSDYNDKLSEKVQWRAAMQLKLLSDFFLRFGTFDDKGKMEKGSGAGIGWVQPRLVINLALKNTDVLESEKLNQESEEIKETSFSLSYRF